MSTTTSNTGTLCYKCGFSLSVSGKVHRRDECPKCGSSLHACRFCTFYDIKHYNECREPSADRVVDKEKENYCDYYVFNASGQPKSPSDSAADVKKKLDDLFK